jgi:hypothetical protein
MTLGKMRAIFSEQAILGKMRAIFSEEPILGNNRDFIYVDSPRHGLQASRWQPWPLRAKSKTLLPAQGTSRSGCVRVGKSLKRASRSRHR